MRTNALVGECGRSPGLTQSLSLLGGLEDLEGAHQGVVNGHHRPRVVELAAVVRRGEDGHQLAAGEELVSVLDHLVSPTYEVEVVAAEELRDHVFPEGKRDAAVVLAPADDVLVGVRPKEVAK